MNTIMSNRPRHGVTVALGALALSAACARPAGEKPAGPSAALAGFVLSDVPKDIAHETFIDFGGKVHLVGYSIEPEGVVRPGSKAKLTLFWRSNQALGPGWNLFTHLESAGIPSKNLDDAGPLRKPVTGAGGTKEQALGPSLWEPGRVYVDEVDVEMDKNVDAAEVTILVGVWHEAPVDERAQVDERTQKDTQLTRPSLRLPVLSGPSDDTERAVVLHIPTGRTPGTAKVAKAAQGVPVKRETLPRQPARR